MCALVNHSPATLALLAAVVSDPRSSIRAMAELTETEQKILTFERQWWKYAGAKESAVREEFDMSATRYYQVLNCLIDRPEALAHDPMLVRRLRRLRSARKQQRDALRLGFDLG